VGAVLDFAINVQNTNGVDVNTIGVILMIVGALGLIATLLIWGPRSRRTVVEDGVTGRRLYRRDEF
jgi:hypothetical protein